jgi:hypothetical protein
MEYACIIWDPVTQTNIRELEMMQRRAARFVTGDYRNRLIVDGKKDCW